MILMQRIIKNKLLTHLAIIVSIWVLFSINSFTESLYYINDYISFCFFWQLINGIIKKHTTFLKILFKHKLSHSKIIVTQHHLTAATV